MKKMLLSLVGLALLTSAISSCKKNDPEKPETPLPELIIHLKKSTLTTADFTFNAIHAQKIAYLVLNTTDAAPEAENVMINGTPVDLTTEEISIPSLDPQTEYVLYLAAQNEDRMVISSQPFTTNYLLWLKATHSKHHYYGDYFTQELGVYYMSFSDMELDNQLLPMTVGQEAVRLLFVNNLSEDSNSAELTPGKYTVSGDVVAGAIYKPEAHYTQCKSLNDKGLIGERVDYTFKEGMSDVKKDKNGYSMIFEGTLSDENSSKIRIEYTGEIIFRNLDKKSYVLLKEDIEMKPENIGGRYMVFPAQKPGQVDYGNFSIALYNVVVDGEGFVAGAGELLNCEFLTKPNSPMNLNDLSGSYDILIPEESAVYAPGFMVGGMVWDFMGMYYPGGTSYTLYDEYAVPLGYALVSGGSAKVTVEEDMINFDLEFETSTGSKLIVKYSGSAKGKIADYTTPNASSFSEHLMYRPCLQKIEKTKRLVFAKK